MTTASAVSRPSVRSMKVLDYSSTTEYFKRKHRITDKQVSDFWDFVMSRFSTTPRFAVVEIEDVMLRASESASHYAALLQKEFKDRMITLDFGPVV